MLSTWSTMSCTARLTRLTLVARPSRAPVITSLVTATPWRVDPLGLLLGLLGVRIVLLRARRARPRGPWTPADARRSNSSSNRSSGSPRSDRLSSRLRKICHSRRLADACTRSAADREGPQHGQDVAERRVVVELEPEAGGVDEDEVARQADLQVGLEGHQRARGGVEIVERLLDRRVLDRIELEAPERRVEREQQRPPALAEAARRTRRSAPARPASSRARSPGARGSRRCAPPDPCPPRPAGGSRAPRACGSSRARSRRRRGSPRTPSSAAGPRGSSSALSGLRPAGAGDGRRRPRRRPSSRSDPSP